MPPAAAGGTGMGRGVVCSRLQNRLPGSAKAGQANNEPLPTSRVKTQVRGYDRLTVNVSSFLFKATGTVFQSVDGNVRSTPGNLTLVMCLIC